MSSSSSSPVTATKVFDSGKHQTEVIRVEASSSSCCLSSTTNKSSSDDASSVPKTLLIFTPLEAGEFPVILLLHGYLLYNSFYSQLSHHIASHGFILVLPQLYFVAGPDTTEEIMSTAAVTNWLPGPKGLQNFLPLGVHANFKKLGLAGHSRGGKAAFALALNKLNTELHLPFSALIGIDPVDGMDKGKQTPPPVLTYKPHSFDLEMPVMVIGSGLGEVRKNPLFPACAPKGVNHRDFYNECRRTAFHFVAKNYGHLDMLDDETKGIRGKTSYCLCKNGKAREPMRRFVGGIMVAFGRAYLGGNSSDLMAIVDGPEIAPVDLEEVDFLI